MRYLHSQLHFLLIFALFAGLLFLLDLNTPLGMLDGILYLPVVLVSVWLPFPKAPLLAAGASSVLIALGFFLSLPGDVFHSAISRSIVLALLWATALIVTKHRLTLVQTENRFRDLVGSVPAIVWRRNSTTFRFTFVSPQAETLLGYSPHHWTEDATFWESRIVPEDRERILAASVQALLDGRNCQFDYRMIAADGRIVWLRDYITITTEKGRPSECIGVMVDITVEKLAEDAARTTEARYRALVELSPDAIFVNRNNQIVFINSRGLHLFRATSLDQILGRSPIELFHPNFHKLIQQHIDTVMQTGVPAGVLEEQILCLDGSVIDVEVNAARIIDAGMPALQVVLRDISGRRLAEHEQRILLHTLGERVKELTLLQTISRLFQDHTRDIDAIMNEAVSLIPSGWQYPHLCEARIIANSTLYTSKQFRESPWTCQEPISFGGETRGVIEIIYREQPEDTAQEPFLQEERQLLKALAEQCALFLERRYALTALRHNEARFRESAEQTQLMMDSLPVLVAYVDRDHRYQQNNETYRLWFGRDITLLKGRHVEDVLGATTYQAIRPHIEAALRGEALQFESIIHHADGRDRMVHASYIPHHGEAGEVLGFYALVQDVSARKQAEAALDQLLGELEKRVADRTAALQDTNAALMKEVVHRQEIESALRRSESRLAEAQSLAHLGSWDYDFRENCLRWSEETHRIFEVDPSHFIPSYRAFLNLVHPQDRPQVYYAYTTSLKNRTPYEFVHRLLMPDGRIKYVLERCNTTYDAQGVPIRSHGTTQDITDRKLAEEQLQRSEEQYRVLYEHNPSMYFTVAPDGRVLSVNRFGAEQLGYSPEELIGHSVLLVIHPDDHAQASEHLRHCTNNPGQVWNWEFRKIRKDGSVLWVRETARSCPNSQHQFVLFIVCEDITARKQTEEALYAAHVELEQRVVVRTAELSAANYQLRCEIADRERAELAVESRDAILDAVGVAARQLLPSTSWTDQVQEVLGHLGRAAEADRLCIYAHRPAENGELEIHLHAEWFAPDISSQPANAGLHRGTYEGRGLGRWRNTLANGLSLHGPVTDFPSPERTVLIDHGLRSVAILPIFVGQELWGILVCGVARSERTWQVSDLDALQVAASTLGAAIQRERMEAQIRLYAEELEALVSQRTQRVKELESQRAQAEKLAALGQLAAGVAHEINNPIAGIKNAFLVLKEAIPLRHPYYHFVGMIEREIERVAHIVRRMYDLYRHESHQVQVIALDLLIEDLTYLLKPKLTQYKVILQTCIPPNIPPLRVVQRDLLQILLNLVQNAIEASQENGTVTVDVSYDLEQIRISVSDQGYGIAPAELPHIFEPFFSGQQKRKVGGIGLGLSVSYSLVQAMGGRINVDSQPDKGSTFIVLLPLAQQSQIPSHVKGKTP